jgi:hypothetical protein
MRLALIASCAALAACAAAEPAPYHSGNEIPQGPGLFTGPDGAFVLRPFSASRSESAAPRNAAAERELDQ